MNQAIRKASSLIAGRDGKHGLELLFVERGASSRFLPGYVAFPGGAVEAWDGDLAARWFGTSEEARRAGAVRELVEEAGLALTGAGVLSASSIDAVHDRPPRASQLVEIAHWIAPEQVPVRFDARYYAVDVMDAIEPRADGEEVARAWWSSPRSMIAEWEEGRRKLYWPTYFTLTKLARCESVNDLLRLRIHTREPNEIELDRLARSTFWQD